MPRIMITCSEHGWADTHVDDVNEARYCLICNAQMSVREIDETTQIISGTPLAELMRMDAAAPEQPKVISTFKNAQGDVWGVVDTGNIEQPTFVLLRKA